MIIGSIHQKILDSFFLVRCYRRLQQDLETLFISRRINEITNLRVVGLSKLRSGGGDLEYDGPSEEGRLESLSVMAEILPKKKSKELSETESPMV